jgi:hypothetical protein
MTDMNRARQGRSAKREVLNALESSTITIEAILAAPIDALATADIYEVLMHVPKLNRKGVRHIFLESNVYPHTRMKELSEEDRKALLAALPQRVKRFTEPNN